MAFQSLVKVIPRRTKLAKMCTAAPKACRSWRVTENDSALAVADPILSESMQEAMKFMPEGAYTSLRTYGKSSFLHLDGHFNRMEETCELLGLEVKMNRAEYRRVLGSLAKEMEWAQTLFRLTIGTKNDLGETWISAQPLKTPSVEDYESGVFVLTRRKQRVNPKAKSNAFINDSLEERKLIGGRVNEVLMIGEDGLALEGLSSNFFGVSKGTVFTAEEGVLPGITRSLILESIEELKIPLQRVAVHEDGLEQLEEAFVSSTSRGVLPVVKINDVELSDGRPGEITARIAAAFNQRVESQLENL